LWQGKKTTALTVSRNFSPSLSVKKYATKSLRLELDLSLIKNSICIDAIQVTGVEGKKMAEVHDEEFLMESLLLYYNNQEFSDMAFICGDKKIYAHTTLVHTLCPHIGPHIILLTHQNSPIDIKTETSSSKMHTRDENRSGSYKWVQNE
jgi:hypothetical protein